MLIELAAGAVLLSLLSAPKRKGAAVLTRRSLELIGAIRRQARAANQADAGPFLIALGAHESRLNPDNGTAGLDPSGASERNAGAFGHTVATLRGLGADVARIIAGDVDAQAKAAVALWSQLSGAYKGDVDRIIAAWWVGPGNLKRIEAGETVQNYYWGYRPGFDKKNPTKANAGAKGTFGVTPGMVADFVREIKGNARSYLMYT